MRLFESLLHILAAFLLFSPAFLTSPPTDLTLHILLLILTFIHVYREGIRWQMYLTYIVIFYLIAYYTVGYLGRSSSRPFHGGEIFASILFS